MTISSGVRFHEQVHGVYFDDLDAFQILHNARYLLLFERTIGSFWKRLGWGSTLDAKATPDQFKSKIESGLAAACPKSESHPVAQGEENG